MRHAVVIFLLGMVLGFGWVAHLWHKAANDWETAYRVAAARADCAEAKRISGNPLHP